MVEEEFDPWSEFKTSCFTIAHDASQLIQQPEHKGEASNMQVCSIHLVFLSWHPSDPLVKCRSPAQAAVEQSQQDTKRGRRKSLWESLGFQEANPPELNPGFVSFQLTSLWQDSCPLVLILSSVRWTEYDLSWRIVVKMKFKMDHKIYSIKEARSTTLPFKTVFWAFGVLE